MLQKSQALRISCKEFLWLDPKIIWRVPLFPYGFVSADVSYLMRCLLKPVVIISKRAKIHFPCICISFIECVDTKEFEI